MLEIANKTQKDLAVASYAQSKDCQAHYELVSHNIIDIIKNATSVSIGSNRMPQKAQLAKGEIRVPLSKEAEKLLGVYDSVIELNAKGVSGEFTFTHAFNVGRFDNLYNKFELNGETITGPVHTLCGVISYHRQLRSSGR